MRPIALRLAGPALGGVVVGAFGTGTAFALDAATFLVSAAALLAMRPRGARPAAAGASLRGDLREGWRFVRRRSWLWATFGSAAIAYLLFMGPVEVLLPLLVKHELRRHRDAARARVRGGRPRLGGLRRALGRRGLPRRDITFMYVVWTLATLAVAGYGLSTSVWQLMLACMVFNGFETAGTIVWATMKQRHVPAAHARPGLQPRLADLDRAAAAVVRAHRPRERRDRRPCDVRRRRACWAPR